ncbi:SPL family radical SAM protein [Desulfofundulus thermosubterraneus]|uniref:DNA repair photolyase n=1 Tax=Desulfofundulus thermosubterraneus DSM 16057 TaxID=1121432 RepID=A0A1M6GY45_9FIRM|nr:radical SAM protein [Desulfofundulus thermosubterraneus]SHJ14834.1 DNA repair photolyase [Desulfofundulus thermosubterraneus DSM 16057]
MSKAAINPTYCKTALSRTGIPGYRYCLNPYVGCSHGCRYCYADTVLRFSGHSGKWGEFVAAKVNFPEVLRRELNRKRSLTGRIIFGTVTDAYQPAEAEFGLTRSSLEVFAEEWPNAEIDLLTKSDLVVRDVDILKKLKDCSIGFTVTTSDDKIASVLEPGAAPPSARLRAAKRLAGEGLHVWAFIAPVLPGVSDAPGVLEELISGLKGAGVKEVYLDSLNPYPASVYRLKVTCRDRLPWALKHLEQYLCDPRGYLKTLSEELAALSQKYGYDLRVD